MVIKDRPTGIRSVLPCPYCHATRLRPPALNALAIHTTGTLRIVDVTGGKGSITQWVNAEYMEGSETICPTFTQWVRGGYFSKVPAKVPTGQLFERT